MFFMYDILGIDFGRTLEEKIVERAIIPDLKSYITRRDELENMIERDPSKAKESYGNRNDAIGKVTNESMLEYYKKRIHELQNWTRLPRYSYMRIAFTDYGSFASSELADAAYEDKWGGVSISSIDEKDVISVEGNTVNIQRDYTDPKMIIKDLAGFKRKEGEKIKLLYSRY